MKKISLITIFDNPNFGTYLQAFALGVILQRYDTKVEIVRYERPTWSQRSKFRKKTEFLSPIRLLLNHIRGNMAYIQKYQCRRFVSKSLKISKTYFSYEQLVSNPPKADIYLTGSDQVWNITHNHGVDKSFYLGYAPSNKPKYAYAASIGMDNIPEEYVAEVRGLLSQYKAISVREWSNVHLLQNIGINSTLVLDPTLLLTKDEWSRYQRKFYVEEPYVLVYSVESSDRSMLVGRIAEYIATEKGFKVYEVSYSGESQAIPNCDRHFYYAEPSIFLSLLANASFVVGSSFHITAFSINFNIPFISVAPDRFSSRIDSILNLCHLEDRKISEYDSSLLQKMVETEIDFAFANSVLKAEQSKSMRFIEEIIR